MIGPHGHCAECQTPVPIDRTHCTSCAWGQTNGLKPPDLGFNTDVTDAFADLLPEMQEDVLRA